MCRCLLRARRSERIHYVGREDTGLAGLKGKTQKLGRRPFRVCVSCHVRENGNRIFSFCIFSRANKECESGAPNPLAEVLRIVRRSGPWGGPGVALFTERGCTSVLNGFLKI